jgi:hypothetical protein
MGTLFDLNSGISFSAAAVSASLSCFSHCWRACRLSPLMRPVAACSTAPKMAPGSPTSPKLDVAILADRAVVHVDLHQLEILADALAVAHAEIERSADDHQHVGVGKRLGAGAIEVMRIAGRQQAAARAVEIAGNVEAAQQRNRLLVAARSPHLLPVQDGGPLRIDENIGQFLDVARIADGAGRRTVLAGLRDDGLVDVDLAVQYVARNFQVRGPGRAVERLAAAMEIMSATRSVLGTVAANLVMGVMISTCGRSCSEPILCCVIAP